MQIGFSQKIISPKKGIILAGYATEDPRKNIGVHDDLYCKALVLNNINNLYAILVLDIMCVDQSLADRVIAKLGTIGFAADNVIVAGIHTHSGPSGVFLNEGELSPLNFVPNNTEEDGKIEWLESVVDKCFDAVAEAKENLDDFEYRFGQSNLPEIGSDRNTGDIPNGKFNVIDIKTKHGKSLLVYNFACHPTVMNPKNLYVSADFIGHVAPIMDRDMCMFFNGPAGDVSTRFYRKESSFEECERMAKIAVDVIDNTIGNAEWKTPKDFAWKKQIVELEMREILDEKTCQAELDMRQKDLQEAIDKGVEGKELRVIKSYEEGAAQNLKYSNLLRDCGFSILHLPVTYIKLDNVKIASIPGELFSALIKREDIMYICYANGYYRYIPDKDAFEKRYYEALGSIIKPGQGEVLIEKIEKEL